MKGGNEKPRAACQNSSLHRAKKIEANILREHVIDRLYNQSIGYWQADLQGLAHPSRADRAALLVDYLGLSGAHCKSSRPSCR